MVVFSSDSAVNDMQCQEYVILGDDITELDKEFVVSVNQINNFDMISGPSTVSVTILDDDNGKVMKEGRQRGREGEEICKKVLVHRHELYSIFK